MKKLVNEKKNYTTCFTVILVHNRYLNPTKRISISVCGSFSVGCGHVVRLEC